MANIPLRSIKFPGLSDTYTIPDASDISSDLSMNIGELVDTNYTIGTKYGASGTSANWKLVSSGSAVSDSNYIIDKYYLTAGKKYFLYTTGVATWQFQNGYSIPSGENTYLVGTNHDVLYYGVVTIPTGVSYIMLSRLKTDNVSGVYAYSEKSQGYIGYINKESQTVFTSEYDIYFEKDTTNNYLYIYAGAWYFRGAFSKTFAISALGDALTLYTSPNGTANCVRVPFGYSIVYDIDSQELSIKSSYTQYEGYKSIVVAYISTSGNLQGGVMYDRWLYLLTQQNTGTDAAFGNKTIPSYYDTMLETKKASIISAMSSVGKNGFTFAFTTDQHLSYNSGNTPSLIRWLNRNTRLKYVISGGDIIDVESTKTAALAKMSGYVGEFEYLNIPMFQIMGNHDYNTETTSAVSGENITIPEFYSVAMRQMEGVTFFDSYMDYYYIDETTDTGLIFLQTGVNNGSYHLNQNDAIASILPSMPDHVIIFGHLLTKTENSTTVTNANWNTLVNGNTAQPGLNGMADKSKIKAIVAGHQHADYTVFQDGFRLIVTTTDSYKVNNSYKDTTNEVAFDIMTFDYTNNSVKCVRFGRGNDRTISLTS